jgi:leucyl aminopeptidase
MKTGFNKEPWKTLLPETYEWSQKVVLDTIDSPVQGACHIVCLAESKSDTDKSDKTESDDAPLALNAPSLSDSLKTKILDTLNTTGFKGASPSIVVVDQATYLVMPPVKIKTTKPQKGRSIGLTAVGSLKNLKASHVVVCKADGICSKSVVDGLSQGLYNCTSFKIQKKDPPKSTLPTRISLLGGTLDATQEKELRMTMKSVTLTRFIQDAPANWFDPLRFAEIAEDVSKDHGLKVSIHDRASLEKFGMGSFLSVNNGSHVEARMIVIEIDGVDNNKCVALIGKGLTFDAGGVSLKPGAGMEEMKYDMSGGAAVLGSALLLSAKKPPVKTVCIIGATENLVSSKATKPGDIVVAMNGKTIEIQNTDAEGRLVLADLVHYANVTYKPEMMIDVATLTGAVLIALGTVGAGLMSNDDGLASHILKASQEVGEPFWQLPMWPELEAETKGATADLNNIAKGSVKAGTIMGAMFIKEFVGSTKWAHLDIAGTGWNCKATGFPGTGGSAYGLRTMVESVMRFNS